MHLKSRLFLTILPALCFATASPATVLHNTFDAGGGFHPVSNLVGASSQFINPQTFAIRSAARFTVAGGNFKLNSITLPVSVQGALNRLRLRIAQDNAGAPGATLEILSENQTIWPSFTSPFVTATTVASTTHPLLLNGQSYWVVLEPTALTPNSDYRWFINTSGATSQYRQHQTINQLPADPWAGASAQQGVAFRVDGISTACPADVTRNRFINADDLLAVINAWGQCPPTCAPTCLTLVGNTFNANGSFDPQQTFGGAGVNGTQAYRTAAKFTVAGTNFLLTSIRLPVSFDGVNNRLRVRIAQDTANAPGSTLEVLSENQMIWSPFANPFTTATTVFSTNNPLLMSGQSYWIVLEPTVFAPAYNYRWFINNTGVQSPCRQHQASNQLPVDPWPGNPTQFQVAYKVEGLETRCPADITGNNFVNVDDLLAVINAWGPCPP